MGGLHVNQNSRCKYEMQEYTVLQDILHMESMILDHIWIKPSCFFQCFTKLTLCGGVFFINNKDNKYGKYNKQKNMKDDFSDCILSTAIT